MNQSKMDNHLGEVCHPLEQMAHPLEHLMENNPNNNGHREK